MPSTALLKTKRDCEVASWLFEGGLHWLAGQVAQGGKPPGCTNLLAKLVKAGVLRVWLWEENGVTFLPRDPSTGSQLFVFGPKWEQFEQEARAKGLVPVGGA